MNRNSTRSGINPQLSAAFKRSAVAGIYRKDNPLAFDNIASKMVAGQTTQNAIEDKELQFNATHDPFFKSALSRSLERINDNNNILQLLPDIKLAIEIIIGGVLSPRDLMKTTLTFTSNNEVFQDKLAVAMLSIVDNYFVSSYKLTEELPKMLRDILAKTGSYPLAVLPETSVDYIINSNSRVTLESLTTTARLYNSEGKLNPIGLLANAKKAENTETLNPFQYLTSTSMESGRAETNFDDVLCDSMFNITVTDNFDALKIPSLTRKVSAEKQQVEINRRRELIKAHHKNEKIRYGNHDMISVESTTIDSKDYKRSEEEQRRLAKLYPERTWNNTPILRVKPKSSLDKPTFGHPLVMKLPTESVIPVFSPTDPSDHLGYFVALDNVGNPLRLSELENIYRMLSQQSNTNSGAVTSWLLNQAATNTSPAMVNGNQLTSLQAINQAAPIFQQLLEADLLDRVERGALGSGVSMGKNDDLYRLMLARACAGKHTQMLYLPAGLLSYMAIDWDEYGLGKTLLDDSKTLAALRSMQMFINSMASSKNAITKRVLRAALDPAEKNPQRAIEIVMHEFAKSTQSEYPLTNNPIDQINYLQMAGVQVHIEEHPRLPNTQIGVDYLDNQYKQVDTMFDDWLKKQHTAALGLSPEVVEGAGSADFATQTIFANVMTQRRIMLISQAFCKALSHFVRLYTYNSQILMDELIECVKTSGVKYHDQFNKPMTDEEVAVKFLDSLEVSLPLPDTTSVKEQKETYDDIKEFYEDAIEQFFSEGWITTEDLGDLAQENIETTKKFLLAHYMRKWMRENGVLNEMFDLVMKDDSGEPMFDALKEKEDYMDILGKTVLPMLKRRKARTNKINQEVEKLNETYPDASEGGADSFGGGDSYGSDGGSSDDLDDGFDDDLPDLDLDETTTDTESTDGEGDNADGTDESSDDDGNTEGDAPKA